MRNAFKYKYQRINKYNRKIIARKYHMEDIRTLILIRKIFTNINMLHILEKIMTDPYHHEEDI